MYGLQRTDVAGIKKPAVRKNSGLFDVNFSKSLSLFNIVSVPKSIWSEEANTKKSGCAHF